MRHLWQVLEEAAVAPAILCCTPHCDHLLFHQHSAEAKWLQQGEDLGERMFHAASRALVQAESVLLLGTDCPGVTRDYLVRAFQALHRAEVVIGPAEDGGYVLLGLRRVDRKLFRGLAWGTSSVLEQTLERVMALGWRHALLEPLWDVDRPRDVERLAREFPAIFSG
jgi:rSAM/selenodomain-associated transferase 1